MEGWKLKSGLLDDSYLEKEKIACLINGFLFSDQYKTSTYKYALFKVILDNIFTLNGFTLSLKIVENDFAKIYWNLVNVDHLPQRKDGVSSIERIVSSLVQKYPRVEGIPFDSLSPRIRKEYLSKAGKIPSKYVLGALYGDFNGKLYGFDKKEYSLVFNPCFVSYLQENKRVYDKLTFYQWMLFIEKRLKKTKAVMGSIGTRLDEVTKRDRSSLERFKKEIYQTEGEHRCFYCGKKLENSCHLDHFIPWSFYKQDVLWNFVCACPKCNESKNNRLAPDPYLHKLEERNEITSFIPLLHGYKRENLDNRYKKALFNGISIWIPKMMPMH